MKKIIAIICCSASLAFAQVSYFPWSDVIPVSAAMSSTPGAGVALDNNPDRVYYIGNDTKVHYYYKDVSNNWQETPMNLSAPTAAGRSGIVFDALGKLYYVGSNGYINQCLPGNPGAWTSGQITTFYSGTYVAARYESKLAVSFPGGYLKIYYIATDNYLHYVQWTNNGWITGKLSANSVTVAYYSDLVTDIYGKVYFLRYGDNQVCGAFDPGGGWVEGLLTGTGPAGLAARPTSDLVIDENGKVYYIGSDNKIHCYFWTTQWQEGVLNTAAPTVKTGCQFTYNNGNVIYCSQNPANLLYSLYWDGCLWQYNQLNNSNSFVAQTATLWKSRYVAGKYTDSYAFDFNGKLHVLSPKIDVYNTTNAFVYVKGSKLMLNNSPYYVRGVNYLVALNKNLDPAKNDKDSLYLSRYHKYCSMAYRCTNVPSAARTGLDIDLRNMKNAGFNTVRLMAPKFIGNNCGGNPSYFFDITTEHYNGSSYDPFVEGTKIAVDDNFFDNTYMPLLKNLIAIAKNNGLKVILVTGFDNPHALAGYPLYEHYLTKIAQAFIADPTLMAIDFMNEPDGAIQCPGEVYKPQVCTLTKDMYNAVRSTGSKALTTIGTASGFNLGIWDPYYTTVDFYSPHFYGFNDHEVVNSNFTGRMNNVESTIIYYSKILNGKPWIAEETGLSAVYNNLTSPTYLVGTGNSTDQSTFAANVSNWLNEAGSSGYMWWDYADTDGGGGPPNIYGDYYGIFASNTWPANPSDYTQAGSNYILKPAASSLLAYGGTCSSGPLTPPSTYYDFDQQPQYGTNAYLVTGVVKDNSLNVLENAVVTGYFYDPIKGADGGEVTFTKADGSFSLYTDYLVHDLFTIAPGKGLYQTNTSLGSSHSNPYAVPADITIVPISCTQYQYSKLMGTEDNTIISSDGSLIVFPNPSSSGLFQLYFNEDESKRFEYEIYNIEGQLIKKGEGKAKQSQEINLNENPSGMYFVRLNDGKKIITKKIVKE